MKRLTSKLNIIACLLVALAILTPMLFALPSSADDKVSFKLSLSSIEASLNTEVTLTVTYTSPVDSGFVSYTLQYDNAKLTFVPGSGQQEAAGYISEMLDFAQNENSKSFTRQYKFKTKEKEI